MRNRDATLSKKQSIVDAMSEKINGSEALFFTNNNGLSVAQVTELRTVLRKQNASYTVIKNSLLFRVFGALNVSCPDAVFYGPTGVVVSSKNCPEAAETLVNFSKSNPVLDIKGGILEGAYISSENIKSLAKLPSKDQLIGQFVGGLNSVISRLVQVLSSPTRGFVISLDLIKNKK